jgi:hypothetical protein
MGRIGARDRRRRGRETGTGRRRLRPTVMALEARTLLSTLTVSNTNDSGAGSLRAAVNQANVDGGGDTILFSSLFNTPQTIALTGGQIELTGKTGPTTIQGPGANLLSVSGNNVSRVFQIDANVSASISGVTISGGNAGNSAGGGLSNAGTLDLTACTVSGNSAAGGAGLYNKGTLDLTACTVSGNSAEAGGGGLYSQGGTATMALTNCTVSGNSANKGGGLVSSLGTLTLTNCTVSGNTTQNSDGTALNNYGGTLTLTNTIVEGNSGGAGDFEGPYLGGNNLIGGDALLAPLGDYGGPTQTMALLPGNPAIGMGITADDPATGKPITTDQRGFTLDSPASDIGAFQTNPLAVNSTLDGAGSPPGVLTLRQAVNLAEALGGAEAITFDPTVFATRQTITLDGTQIELKSGTTITGPGAGLLTVSGNNLSRVFEIDANATASISGLTITGGFADRGGGLRNLGGTLSMTGCSVTGSAAIYDGGGLYNESGTITLTSCTISGNKAVNHMTVINCQGGGLFNAGDATLKDCTVSSNYSAVRGGGLYNKSTLDLTGCTLSGNTAVEAGGLYNQGGTTTMTNCTVSGSAQSDGGVVMYAGTLSLINCTISGNYSMVGYALRIGGGSTTLTNTIVAGNSSPYSSNPDLAGGFSGSNNLISVNPLRASLGDYGGPTLTYALLPGSPAIGGGTAKGAPATDQRGVPRSGRVDIGAFQSQGFLQTPVNGSTPQSAAVNSTFALPLAVRVTAVNPAEPVDGGVVTFIAPASGASSALSATTAVIAGGTAGVNATANNTMGTYTVTASAAGAGSASFALTNIESSSLVVTTTRDVVDQVDGLTSLREAIAYANSHPGPDTITFNPAVISPRPVTIRLTGGPLVLADPATTTIIGPGAKRLTISGGLKSRVFDVRGGSVALSGLTITGGRADLGGGVRNRAGDLALSNVVIRGNRAFVGGGLFNTGRVTVSGVTIKNNHALIGGNVFNSTRATLHWQRVRAVHQGRARVSSGSQERTSWGRDIKRTKTNARQ